MKSSLIENSVVIRSLGSVEIRRNSGKLRRTVELGAEAHKFFKNYVDGFRTLSDCIETTRLPYATIKCIYHSGTCSGATVLKLIKILEDHNN